MTVLTDWTLKEALISPAQGTGFQPGADRGQPGAY